MNDDSTNERLDDLEQRLGRMEQLMGLADWQPTPGFDLLTFQRVLGGYGARFGIVFGLVLFALLLTAPFLERAVGLGTDSSLFGLPFFVTGTGSGQYDVTILTFPVGVLALNGIGLLSFGSAAFGIIAIGGLGVGVFAVGGGAIGLIAFGGGALGVIAIGGGAVGYVAIGGGAYGTYVLAGDGKGRYVLDRRRQDEQAVQFFCKYLPRLRQAFTKEENLDEESRTS